MALRECLRGQFRLDGAIAEVRSLQWDMSGVHCFENSDYVVSRPIARSKGNQPIRWRQQGEAAVRPWGAVAIVPPGLPITLEVDPGEVTFISCFLAPEPFERSLELDVPRGDLTAALISNPFLSAVLDRLAREILTPQPKSRPLVETLVASVSAEVGSLVRHIDQTRPGTGTLARWQLKVITKLLEEVASQGQRIHLEEVAACCSISVRHLVRAFKKSTGTTIHSYIRQFRLERIKTLLASDDLPMAAIAAATGYANASQFSAEFRRLTGCSPSAYRRQCRAAAHPARNAAWHRPPL